jgi:hypothetical protein
MNAGAMPVWVLLPTCGLGYGLFALRADESSVIGWLLGGICISTLAAVFELWVNELYRRDAFTMARYLIFPGVVTVFRSFARKAVGSNILRLLGRFWWASLCV